MYQTVRRSALVRSARLLVAACHDRPSTLELRPSYHPSTAAPPGIDQSSRHAGFPAHRQMFVAD
jgi:hypothetical protein